ncbi:Phenylalanyl-tRNA synthetase beta subunit [Pseudomonas syringae pv. actinidiae]|jgi:hypothetical protein|uniref:Phenylalanyl-tRNA synthetase beta subunit n=1 Tax=Pseudomonas syringae pv. actinidiae TaxID=103796 RepID=A0A2V0QR03_PSESF|nr:Phenylalanyl-tRNA synthetase beta subunit [Pseudomonas syringae pv. actinidiae]
MEVLDTARLFNGTHYIYTTARVQYKRLFESAAGQINHRRQTRNWPIWRIDRIRRNGQDTGGFAFAVG